MVVKRKPVNVEEFIQDGGSEAQITALPIAVAESADDEIKGLKLRLPVELLAEIDAAVKRRRPSPSRHQWILEAIYEKLGRETPESNLIS